MEKLTEEGALVKEGGGAVPWRFAGEPGPVGLEYRAGGGTVLVVLD